RSVMSEVTLDGRRDWTIPLKPKAYASPLTDILDVCAAIKTEIDAYAALTSMTGWQPCVRCYESTMPDLAGSGLRTVYICPTNDEHRGATEQGQGRLADRTETHTFGVFYNISLYPCVTIEGKGAEGPLTDDEGLEAMTKALKALLRFNDLDGAVEYIQQPIGVQRDVGTEEHGKSFYHKLNRVMLRCFMGQDET
ncbi:MAG: hypothetical protein JXB46_02830, partial [Candidatus Eisenbacteria bacterium]|nr:hypothetical protein [Candidatus Eisenbacteria bacterium]